ncbi:MAG: phosphatidate cytidylyltransferase [Pirellulaceae bacterium]
MINALQAKPALMLLDGARWLNKPTYWLLAVVLLLLIIACVIGQALKRQPESHVDHALLRRFNLRVRAWWMIFAILIAGFLLGSTWTVVLFGVVSFWALREFITMTPTRRGDHRALFWVFFVLTPLQYVLVGIGRAFVEPQDPVTAWLANLLGLTGVDSYGLYSIMIPVYASLFIPARIAFSGDHKRFLERTAKIQAGLLICVYALSYAPALLQLELQTYKPPTTIAQIELGEDMTIPPESQEILAPVKTKKRLWVEGSLAGLLFYFILVVQLGDLFQYVWGKMLGRRAIAPEINASRTWEGFLGGTATTTLVGSLLWWVTPFRIWEAALMAMITAIMGFAGGMTLSAIKRDRGVRDTGTLVQGHAGLLDQIDSMCFSAPVFFHLTRFFFSSNV